MQKVFCFELFFLFQVYSSLVPPLSEKKTLKPLTPLRFAHLS